MCSLLIFTVFSFYLLDWIKHVFKKSLLKQKFKKKITDSFQCVQTPVHLMLNSRAQHRDSVIEKYKHTEYNGRGTSKYKYKNTDKGYKLYRGNALHLPTNRGQKRAKTLAWSVYTLIAEEQNVISICNLLTHFKQQQQQKSSNLQSIITWHHIKLWNSKVRQIYRQFCRWSADIKPEFYSKVWTHLPIEWFFFRLHVCSYCSF